MDFGFFRTTRPHPSPVRDTALINTTGSLGQQHALGDTLLTQGLISRDQLNIAIQEQNKTGELLGHVLIRLGFIPETSLMDVLGAVVGTLRVKLQNTEVEQQALALVPEEFARQYRVLPISWDGENLGLAMADAHDIVVLDRIKALLPRHANVQPYLAGESELAQALDQHYGHELSIDGILHEIETGEIDPNSLPNAHQEYSQPVVRLVNALLADAVKRGASDIHFEPEQNFLRIRYRLDGLLQQIRALHRSYWSAMAVRIKVISGLNIAESRLPQDGHIAMQIHGRSIDFRVSSHPTIHGENIVLRILDRQKGLVPLVQLGLRNEHIEQLQHLMARPEGLILMTGPTGSGKTTTLYAALNLLNQESTHIMTLEDPVEYPMPLMRQTTISDTARLSFADGIRSMMRQDPDVILVGEIRDRDTAEMALRAAMTGHQVYSTLHTNSALGAIPRLLDIGIVPDILASHIIGIIAQRLVRRLCPHCKQTRASTPEESRLYERFGRTPPQQLFHPVGCPLCQHQGYTGRLVIIEILAMDPELDDMLTRRASLRDMRLYANRCGFRSLAEDGLGRAEEGLTTIAEVRRVVDLSHHIHA